MTTEKKSQSEKLKSINGEVRTFYEFYKEAGLTDEEIRKICGPLQDIVNKATIKKWIRIILVIILAIIIRNTVMQNETVQYKVIGGLRTILIGILPYWDWREFYHNAVCVIPAGSLPKEPEPKALSRSYGPVMDCSVCEAITDIARISSTSYDEVYNQHLVRHAPVIITDAIKDTIALAESFLEVLATEQKIYAAYACHVGTNLRRDKNPVPIPTLFEKKIPSWYLHFQNCDLNAAKILRALIPKPYFLTKYIPPSGVNWILASRNYDTRRFKYLNLDTGLIVFYQILGSNIIKLTPPSACETECLALEFTMEQGETLVFHNQYWNFEYLPGKETNVAMVTETKYWQ